MEVMTNIVKATFVGVAIELLWGVNPEEDSEDPITGDTEPIPSGNDRNKRFKSAIGSVNL